MPFVLNIYQDSDHIDTIELQPASNHEGIVTFALSVDDLPSEVPTAARRRNRRRPVREAIERFADPNREHPVLKKLMSTVAPLAISFLTQQLPEWLGDIDLSSPTGIDD